LDSKLKKRLLKKSNIDKIINKTTQNIYKKQLNQINRIDKELQTKSCFINKNLEIQNNLKNSWAQSEQLLNQQMQSNSENVSSLAYNFNQMQEIQRK
jgi:hypothetical protein